MAGQEVRTDPCGCESWEDTHMMKKFCHTHDPAGKKNDLLRLSLAVFGGTHEERDARLKLSPKLYEYWKEKHDEVFGGKSLSLETSECLKGCIREGGGLLKLGFESEVIEYLPGDNEVWLCGNFGAAELRAIADWIDAHVRGEGDTK